MVITIKTYAIWIADTFNPNVGIIFSTKSFALLVNILYIENCSIAELR